MWDEIKNRFSALFTSSPTLLIVLVSSLISAGVIPQTVRAGDPCGCKDIDAMAKEIERMSTAEEAWKEIFAWARGLRSNVAPPKTNDELNAKYVQLVKVPRSEWDRIMREPLQASQAPTKIGGLNEKGEPIIDDAYRMANCDEIVEAVRVHERAHRDFFTGYSLDHVLSTLMESRLLRLRAESEVVSYRAGKAYLLPEKQKLETKCKRFKVDQPFGDGGRISGVICSGLDKPISLNFEAASVGLVGVLTLTPSGNGRGTYSYSGYLKSGGVTDKGVGNFRIEGVEKGTPVIQMDAGEWSQTTEGFGTISGDSSPETILLEPTTDECR